MVLRVAQVSLECERGADVLSAQVGSFRLWFRFPPGSVPEPRGDSFIVASLIAAMALHEPLELDGATPVSPALLEQVPQIQDILACWHPDLRRVAVSASRGTPPTAPGRTGSFYSGGVDSAYTFLQRQPEITDLIFIKGFDFRHENDDLFRGVIGRVRSFADQHQKRLVVVETNFRRFYEGLFIEPSLYQGALLASIAVSVPMERVFVPAGYSYAELIPWGTHPLLDPLWSTEAVEVVHHGAAARRGEKLAAIASLPGALATLRVCLENRVYNCGQCEKCLRTRLTLRLLGLDSPTLPALASGELSRIRSSASNLQTFFEENLALARAAGDQKAARVLARCLRSYLLRGIVRDIDGMLFGGRVKRLVAWARGQAPRRRTLAFPVYPG